MTRDLEDESELTDSPRQVGRGRGAAVGGLMAQPLAQGFPHPAGRTRLLHLSNINVLGSHTVLCVKASLYHPEKEHAFLAAYLSVQQCRRHHGDDVSLLWVDVEHVGGWLVRRLLADVVSQ